MEVKKVTLPEKKTFERPVINIYELTRILTDRSRILEKYPNDLKIEKSIGTTSSIHDAIDEIKAGKTPMIIVRKHYSEYDLKNQKKVRYDLESKHHISNMRIISTHVDSLKEELKRMPLF